MENRNYKLKMNAIRNTNPQKLNEKIKFYSNKNSLNTLFKNKNSKNKIPFKIKKNKFQNRTFFDPNEKESLPKIQPLNIKKENIFKPKIRHINSEHFNFNKIKKIRSSSQENNNQAILTQKKFRDLFNSRIEKEVIKAEQTNKENIDTETMININIDEFMEKIKKDYSDIGKLVKMNFIVDEERKYEYEKNEFVILKIIENDLKEKLIVVPKEVDNEVAKRKLKFLGKEIDTLTDFQKEYLSSSSL